MPVKIAGRLPSAERNGLADLTDVILEHPKDVIICVVALVPKTEKHSLNADEDDEVVVEVAIGYIEPLSDADRSFAEAAATTAREKRTGIKGLPFGSVTDVESGGEGVLDEYGKQGVAEAERLANAAADYDRETGEKVAPEGETPKERKARKERERRAQRRADAAAAAGSEPAENGGESDAAAIPDAYDPADWEDPEPPAGRPGGHD